MDARSLSGCNLACGPVVYRPTVKNYVQHWDLQGNRALGCRWSLAALTEFVRSVRISS
jgi:hypothetical protein